MLLITDIDLMFQVASWAMGLLPAIAVGLVVVLALRSRRPAAKIEPVHMAGDVVLYGHLWRPGDAVSSAWDGATYGTVVVTAGELLWHGAGGAWRTPLATVTVLSVDGFAGLTGPAVDLDIAGSGRWRILASSEPINRFVRNDVKKARQAADCRRFAGVLLARGARPLLPGTDLRGPGARP